MTDKQIIIDGVDVAQCKNLKPNFYCADSAYHLFDMTTRWMKCENCHDCCYKQLARKTQDYTELRQYHNKCCNEWQKENEELIEKYNKLSRDFYNGKYCNKEHCDLLKAKTQECEALKEDYEELEHRHNEAYHDFERLKQACEELKEKNFDLEDKFACEIQARLYHQNEWLKFSVELDRYRKALEAIEEIIKEGDCTNCREYYYNQHCEDCDKGEILDIISKAKGEQ